MLYSVILWREWRASGGLTTFDGGSTRKSLIATLRYLSSMEMHSPHWKDDGHAASLLAGAIEND
jgi:hypothetical protein